MAARKRAVVQRTARGGGGRQPSMAQLIRNRDRAYGELRGVSNLARTLGVNPNSVKVPGFTRAMGDRARGH